MKKLVFIPKFDTYLDPEGVTEIQFHAGSRTTHNRIVIICGKLNIIRCTDLDEAESIRLMHTIAAAINAER